jgi:Tol biopolymer transport system component
MLKSGTNLVYIRDFLGHEKVETTETYAKADPETKRVALDAAAIPMENDLPDWSADGSLMAMLKSMGK